MSREGRTGKGQRWELQVQSGLATAPVNVVAVEGLIAKPRRRPEGQRKHSGRTH